MTHIVGLRQPSSLIVGAKGQRRRRIGSTLQQRRTLIDFLVRGGDFLVILVAGLLATWSRFGGQTVSDTIRVALVIGCLLAVTLLPFSRVYVFERLMRLTTQLPRLLGVWGLTIAGTLIVLYTFRSAEELSRLWVGSWFAFGCVGLVLWRSLLKEWLLRSGAREGLTRDVLVIGHGDLIRSCVKGIGSRDQLTRVVAALPLDQLPVEEAALPELMEEVHETIRDYGVDQVVLALPWSESTQIETVLGHLRHLPVEATLYPQAMSRGIPVLGVSQVGDLTMVRLLETPIDGGRAIVKDVVDRMLAGLMLLLLSPFLLLVALAVVATSPGPVFFRQRRYGFNKEPIEIFKFRTMYVDRCDAPGAAVVQQATRDDARITPIGRFLRRYSIDELPQLLNVLKGEMSLVGPRPHALAHDDHYAGLIDDYLSRHRVRPGITGWAQVNGLRGETRTVDAMRRRIEYDLYYIDNWSLMLDFSILVLTLWRGIIDRNAY